MPAWTSRAALLPAGPSSAPPFPVSATADRSQAALLASITWVSEHRSQIVPIVWIDRGVLSTPGFRRDEARDSRRGSMVDARRTPCFTLSLTHVFDILLFAVRPSTTGPSLLLLSEES